MRKPLFRMLSIAIALAVAAPAWIFAAQAPTQLADVLKKMDAAAAGFQTVTANITYTKVTLIVNDRAVEKGQIYFKRAPGKRDARVLIEFKEPSEKIVLFRDNKGSIYRPAIAQVEEYDVSRNKEAMEQFLLLGFGTPGSELTKAYTVTLVGPAKVNGQDSLKLELLPKAPDMARHIKKVELWLSPETWQPIQQQFTEPTNDYLVTEYNNARLNTPIPDSQFELKKRGKVKTVRPQG